MKTKEQIEILAIEHCKNIKGSCDEGNDFSSYIEGYTKCQEVFQKEAWAINLQLKIMANTIDTLERIIELNKLKNK